MFITLPEWRNWYTRSTQNRFPQGLEVQVLSPAPLGNSSVFWKPKCGTREARPKDSRRFSQTNSEFLARKRARISEFPRKIRANRMGVPSARPFLGFEETAKFYSGARGGTRTRTPIRAEDFKSSMSTIPPPGHVIVLCNLDSFL